MKKPNGFTVVELLVTMVVGLLLLISAYQFYGYVLNDSADARRRAIASSYGYELLRTNSTLATNPCSTSSSTPAIPGSAGLVSNATATITISCPSNKPTSVSLITVAITYGNPSVTITHAIYKKTD